MMIVLLGYGQQPNEEKSEFLNLPLTFVTYLSILENQPVFSFKDNALLVQTNTQEDTKHEI